MKALFRAELLKQRTTRTMLQLPLWMVGLVVLVVLLHVVGFSVHDLGSRDYQLKVFGWGTGVGSLFAALLGALSITGEIRHGTIRPTFLATPRRERVIAAKVAASAFGGLALGLLAEALAAAVSSAGLAVRGVHVALSGGDFVQLLAGGAVGAALWAAIGTGIGAVVRNQVGAVVGLCVWLLVIETSLIGSVSSVAKFAPGASAGALAGAIQAQGATNLLAPALGALLLVVYASLATAAGSIAITRRDVT
ncbi:MAG: ABC transporter permease [Solirubrobacteraceae bacterium]|nr:MAG: ABC transporter permease [Solirubrobacterales bacterium]